MALQLSLTMRMPLQNAIRYEVRRSIFAVTTKRKTSVPKPSIRSTTESPDDRTLRILEEQKHQQYLEAQRKHQERLQELKRMTAEVSRRVKEQKESMAADAEQRERLQMPPSSITTTSTTDPDILVSSVKLPEEIEARLGDLTRFLVNRHHQNWPMVVGHLRENGGFIGISEESANEFVRSIRRKHLKPLIGDIESMYHEAGIMPSVEVQIRFLGALATGAVVSPQRLSKIESQLSAIRQQVGIDNALPLIAYETMVVAYGKGGNLDKINNILDEMKKYDIQPSSEIYSNMLSCFVYRIKDHKQAVEIFDSMRFLSAATRPGTREYQNVIVSYVTHDDVEKAIDLYQEMINDKVEINQQILAALARGCANRPQLRAKAWEFMFEIYNHGWEPTLASYEYMIYLAAKDGDLSLARALYSKLIESNSITIKGFGFLLLAYANYYQSEELPAIFAVKDGRTFRNNVLRDSEITRSGVLPFLPKSDLIGPEEVLAESSAMWAFHLLKRPYTITSSNATSYIKIASEVGSISDFIDRYESATYFDNTGAPRNRVVEIDESPDNKANHEVIDNVEISTTPEMNKFSKAPILDRVGDIQKQRKVPRSSVTYCVAINAAGKHKNYDFARQVWTERGQFRKTSAFRQLSKASRDAADFRFAATMINSLTQMNLLEDACALLLSTEWQFKWTWLELTPLHRAAVAVGNDEIVRSVRRIAYRGQINHAGKMTKKDYKKYIMQRGY